MLWKNKVDLMSVQLAKNLEEVMMGKRPFFQSRQGNSFDETGVAAEPKDFLGDEKFSFTKRWRESSWKISSGNIC